MEEAAPAASVIPGPAWHRQRSDEEQRRASSVHQEVLRMQQRSAERELRRRQREMYGQLPRHHHRRRGHMHYGDPAAGGPRYEGPYADEVNVRFEQAEMDFRDRFLLGRERSITAAAAAVAPAPPPPPPHPPPHRLSR